ncbi:MAG: type II toxin-antitoxin system Phd/YefM family antitoxin [Candidatus Dormibacteria bacterium]
MSERQKVSVADFKRDFARYASEVERGGRVLVTRHGKAVGEFIPAGGWSASALPGPVNPGGMLALIGILEGWESLEEDMAEVVRTRRHQRARQVPGLD